MKIVTFFIISIFLLNPLTANDELSRLENLTFLWTWILRWVPRSFATHASLLNTLSSNKLCPKTVDIMAVKGLMLIKNTALLQYTNKYYFFNSLLLLRQREEIYWLYTPWLHYNYGHFMVTEKDTIIQKH